MEVVDEERRVVRLTVEFDSDDIDGLKLELQDAFEELEKPGGTYEPVRAGQNPGYLFPVMARLLEILVVRGGGVE